jgi:hypothetical protein
MTANPIFYRPASRNVRRWRTSGEAPAAGAMTPRAPHWRNCSTSELIGYVTEIRLRRTARRRWPRRASVIRAAGPALSCGSLLNWHTNRASVAGVTPHTLRHSFGSVAGDLSVARIDHGRLARPCRRQCHGTICPSARQHDFSGGRPCFRAHSACSWMVRKSPTPPCHGDGIVYIRE